MTITEPSITILMAVYNGEKYITEQIESIINQTNNNWKLIIQDDGSVDRTCEIAEKFVNRYKNKIYFFRRDCASGSAKNNFFDMFHRYVGTDYIMTCDQDDVWLSDKIETTYMKMLEVEKTIGKDKPVLIHTDLTITDDQLNNIARSLITYERLDYTRNGFNNLLVQNIVTGCTMMINRALADKIHNIPEAALMHDWWCALVAAAFGHIGFIDKPTVLYRQHKGNEVGAKNVDKISYIFKEMIYMEQTCSALNSTYVQAESFMQAYCDQLSEENKRVLAAYISIPTVNKLKRMEIISKFDFWKTSLSRQIGQILFA